MVEETIGQINARYKRIDDTAREFDSLVLKVADVAAKFSVFNASHPDDKYYYFEGDAMALLDVLYDAIRTRSRHSGDRRMTSITTIPHRDLVNALLLAQGRHEKSDKSPELVVAGIDRKLGGRKPRIDAIVREITSAWACLLKEPIVFGWSGFLHICEGIERKHAPSTIRKALLVLLSHTA